MFVIVKSPDPATEQPFLNPLPVAVQVPVTTLFVSVPCKLTWTVPTAGGELKTIWKAPEVTFCEAPEVTLSFPVPNMVVPSSVSMGAIQRGYCMNIRVQQDEKKWLSKLVKINVLLIPCTKVRLKLHVGEQPEQASRFAVQSPMSWGGPFLDPPHSASARADAIKSITPSCFRNPCPGSLLKVLHHHFIRLLLFRSNALKMHLPDPKAIRNKHTKVGTFRLAMQVYSEGLS